MELLDKDQNIYIFRKDSKNFFHFCPDRGGIITNWTSDSENILYFDHDRFLDNNLSIRGGIPILFPICGQLDQKMPFFGKYYKQFNQHGFARDIKWNCEFNRCKECVSLILRETNLTKNFFPFKFILKIDVILKLSSLNFEITIENKSSEFMPISFGLHPYFNISEFRNITFQNFPIICQNQKKNIIVKTETCLEQIHNGVDLLMYTHGKISFEDKGFSRKITLIHPSPIDIGVIWTNPPRKMLCMEPWTSPRNSLQEGIRKILVPPHDEIELFASITKESI